MRRWSWVWMTAVVLSAGVGCADRTTMTRTHGRAYAEAFSKQRANPKAGAEQPPQGLDSQEAAIVAQGYRRSLAPKGAQVQDQPVLWIAPNSGTGAAASPFMPPPSVPPSK